MDQSPILLAIGILGFICISTGVLQRIKHRRDTLFLFGGLFMLAYSIWQKDIVFISLQIVWIGASVFDLYHHKKRRV